MDFVKWAENELQRLIDIAHPEDKKEQEESHEVIMELIKKLNYKFYNGAKERYIANTFTKLVQSQPLTPLTGEDDEWMDATDPKSGFTLEQNKRCMSVFRRNKDNSTATYLHGKLFSDDGGETWWSNPDSVILVTFPFTPPPHPEYIILEKSDIIEVKADVPKK